MTDHISNYLFTPTVQSKDILLGEGISDEKVFVTGNTVVDAVYQNIEIADNRGGGGTGPDLEPNRYFLATAHRQENVDDATRFAGILRGLSLSQENFRFPLSIQSIHAQKR